MNYFQCSLWGDMLSAIYQFIIKKNTHTHTNFLSVPCINIIQKYYTKELKRERAYGLVQFWQSNQLFIQLFPNWITTASVEV